jgi:CHAD domain-containing protein
VNDIINGAPPSAGPPRKPARIVLAPGDPAASAAQGAIRAATEALSAYRAAALNGDAEAVHQMRIATRRLRVTVELCAGVLHGGWVAIVRRELKWLGGVIGAIRDCDVIGELITSRAEKFEPDLAAAVEPIHAALSARRAALRDSIRQAFASKRYESLLGRIAAAPARKLSHGATVRAIAPALLAPIAHRVQRGGAKLKADSDSRAFHKLRIRIKRLRYALEMLANAGGKDVKGAAKRLQKMQELLGDQHDAVMTIEWLREFAAMPASPAPALVAAGALMQSLSRRGHKFAARGCKRWKKLDRGGVMRDALREIEHGSRRSGRDAMQTVDAA